VHCYLAAMASHGRRAPALVAAAMTAVMVVACSSAPAGDVNAFCASVRQMRTVVTTPQTTEPGDPNASAEATVEAYQRGLPFLVEAEKVAPANIRPTVTREVALVRRISQWDISTPAGQRALSQFLVAEPAAARKDNQVFATYIDQACGIAPPSSPTPTS
jgi:hypothetical protein